MTQALQLPATDLKNFKLYYTPFLESEHIAIVTSTF